MVCAEIPHGEVMHGHVNRDGMMDGVPSYAVLGFAKEARELQLEEMG